MSATLTNPGSSGSFNTGAITLNASTYTEVLRLSSDGGAGNIFVRGTVAVAALTHFKVTWADAVGGVHTVFKEDADFNTPDALMPAATNNLYQTASGGTFTALLAGMGGVPEISFWAKGGTGTLTLTGAIQLPPIRII